jgi:hypothetical protein
MTYIHELAGWPNLCWSNERLAEPLAAVRHRQGRLIGRMEAFGFPLSVAADGSGGAAGLLPYRTDASPPDPAMDSKAATGWQ